ncbi:TPA: pyridoxamine 5'-phosphate oxidase, partial [Streptococcus pyogenes]
MITQEMKDLINNQLAMVATV